MIPIARCRISRDVLAGALSVQFPETMYLLQARFALLFPIIGYDKFIASVVAYDEIIDVTQK